MKHSSTTLPARRRPGGARGRATRFAALAAATAAAAALLSGCGIRDTSLPVDAGEGASRTACPPSPGASLSQLVREEYSAPAVDVPSAAPTTYLPASTAPTSTPSPTPTAGGTPDCLQPTPAQVPPTGTAAAASPSPSAPVATP